MFCGNSRASCPYRNDALPGQGKYMTLDTTASDRQSIEIQGHTNADTYEMNFERHLKRIRIEFGGEVIVDSM
jgi:hypothetical protein